MKKRLLPIAIFIIYIGILIKVMVFKDVPTIHVGHVMLNFGGTESGNPANLIPLKTIVPYLFGHKGWIIAGINLIGNIALLVPIGFLAPLVFRSMNWKKSLALAIGSGLFIEVMQTVLDVGIFDIDDVILNALGVMLGYGIFVVLAKWIREKKYIYIGVATIIVIAGALGAFYSVYPRGEQVPNPDAGAVDLCGGTGGTGEIVDQGDNTITIKRNDGVNQVITLTEQTTIKASTGPASPSDLKLGDRVTVVIEDSETASVVLVCSS